MATYLGDRMSELSSSLRTEVSTENQVSSKVGLPDATTAHNVVKYRLLFGLASDEQLMLRTTCSMRKEMNAVKDQNLAFGEMFVFEKHLCFDWKVFGFHKQLAVPFTDVLAVLVTRTKQVEVQCKGMSYELNFTERQEEILSVMEHCRKKVRSTELTSELQQKVPGGERDWMEGDETEMLRELIDDHSTLLDSKRKSSSALSEASGRSGGSSVTGGRLDMTLTEKDWDLFLSGAKLRRFSRDETVISEGQPTAALYQVMQGRVRVELQLPNEARSVVVAHRGMGDMFGEISLLKHGLATASIIADDENTVLYVLEGSFLDSLFRTEPGLPSRFYCFLATTQASRLRELSAAAVSSTKPEVHASNYARLSIRQVMENPAWRRIFRKFLLKQLDETTAKGGDVARAQLEVRTIELLAEIANITAAPESELLLRLSSKTYEQFLASDGELVDGVPVYVTHSAPVLPFITAEMRAAVKKAVSELRSGRVSDRDGRHMYEDVAGACLRHLEKSSFEPFLQSEHYGYVLEMRAKENRIPSLADFRLVRVLGSGGFGQVLEVVKRDCGKRYAIKVMHKDMMKRSLGASWQRKIALERDLLASLDHPFLVNLKYAFQNTEFLVLVMDLVRSNDLSEFVLGKRRLTRSQVKWIIMEVMVVMRHLHSKGVVYRDLKPENLLVDADGHIRLIDMGLAARISKQHPLRRSRVGTDMYMAPEVRFVRERREGYGFSVDWYTLGVLTYELSSGHAPYPVNDDPDPTFREFNFGDSRMENFVKRLCAKDAKLRLGSGPRGPAEIFEHPFWDGIDWELVEKRTMPSPMLSLGERAVGARGSGARRQRGVRWASGQWVGATCVARSCLLAQAMHRLCGSRGSSLLSQKPWPPVG
jgi:serine/threonine protein kinase/CRP-like cAMP-binding protein